MMVVIVTAAVLVLIMMVVMLVIMLLMVMLFFIMMVVIVTAAMLILIMVVMMLMIMFLVIMLFFVMMVVVMFLLSGRQYLCQHFRLQIGISLNGIQNLLAVQLCQRSGDDLCLGIMLTNQSHSLIHLFLTGLICSGQDHRTCVADLIEEELAEVLGIHFALGGIYYRYGTV